MEFEETDFIKNTFPDYLQEAEKIIDFNPEISLFIQIRFLRIALAELFIWNL
jgi:hypothetical protein